AEEAQLHLHGPEQPLWLRRLETEHDNLRMALDLKESPAHLRLAGSLWWFWKIRGYYREGQSILTNVLKEPIALERTIVRAKALHGAGILAHELGELQTAQRLYAESLSIYRELGDQRGTADSLNIHGFLALNQDDLQTARTFFEESLTLARE